MRLALTLCLVLLGTLAWAWSTLAIYFSNLSGPWVRTIAAGAFAIGFATAFALMPNRRRTAIWFAIAVAAVVVAWIQIPARNDRDWLPEYSRTPTADFQGDVVTIHDVRDFEYRTESDFTVRYETRTYDLSKLQSLDFIKSQWAGPDIAHTMLSFGFEDGEYLTVSVETRRERGEPQSAIRGIFKQYELVYVLGEERDIIRLRTSFRGEDVYLYRMRFTKDQMRTVFLDVLQRANDLARNPEFYNTLTDNCTNSLLPHFISVRPASKSDIRFLLNGQSDAVTYERGSIETMGTLEETRAACHINRFVKDNPDPAGFSERIRAHLRPR